MAHPSKKSKIDINRFCSMRLSVYCNSVMKHAIFLLAVLLGVTGVSASAQEGRPRVEPTTSESTGQGIKSEAPRGITKAFYACIDKTDEPGYGGWPAQGACFGAEKKAQDARLNKVYQALLKQLSGKAKDDLVRTQRAWLDFHGKSGLFDRSLYGDDAPIMWAQQSLREIFRLSERANALERYLAFARDLPDPTNKTQE